MLNRTTCLLAWEMEFPVVKVAPPVKLKYLENIFRSKVLTLLLSKGKITLDHINLLKSWKHSDFKVFCIIYIAASKITTTQDFVKKKIKEPTSLNLFEYAL